MQRIRHLLAFGKKTGMVFLVLCLLTFAAACGDTRTPDTGMPPNITTPPSNPNESDSDTSEKPDSPNETWKQTYTLPSVDSVNARLSEIYGAWENTYLLGNTVQRMPCPENGATMRLNMDYEVNAYVRQVLEDAVTEFNEVFSVINPNYKFEINYTPKKEDFDSRYSIRMRITDSFSSPDVMGTAQMSTGTYLSNFGITLKDTTLNDLRYLMLTFRHEFMHLLGAGDAYKNPQAHKTTVMQNYNNTAYRHLSSSDVAFIDAYYRNPANPHTDEYIRTYISDYEKNNSHTQYALLSDILQSALYTISATDLASQLTALHYENEAPIAAVLQNGITPDTAFGTTSVRFTEFVIQKAYRPDKTYFGAFDPANQKYSHGLGIGSFSIPYTDFGNGLLLAMPNGTANMTVFIQTETYVLAFHAEGIGYGSDHFYFAEFDSLTLSLLRVCSVD